MKDLELAKTTGRVEGIEDILINLISALAANGNIDGPLFTDFLRRRSAQFLPDTDSDFVLAKLDQAKESLLFVVDQVERRTGSFRQ
jgi:hypothetical protein